MFERGRTHGSYRGATYGDKHEPNPGSNKQLQYIHGWCNCRRLLPMNVTVPVRYLSRSFPPIEHRRYHVMWSRRRETVRENCTYLLLASLHELRLMLFNRLHMCVCIVYRIYIVCMYGPVTLVYSLCSTLLDLLKLTTSYKKKKTTKTHHSAAIL